MVGHDFSKTIMDQKLLIRFDSDDGIFGLCLYYHGVETIAINFDPWSGKEIRCIYDYDMVKNYEDGINVEEQLLEECKKDVYIYNVNLLKNELREFLKRFGPVDSIKSRKWWDEEIRTLRCEHEYKNSCNDISRFLKGGEEEGMTPLIHIPNIRTYAILNKKEYGGWTAMDYCPFCGAKFPERLDEKLSEILQNEYGLESWRDYKKAPHEFWTDEWWKKRGL